MYLPVRKRNISKLPLASLRSQSANQILIDLHDCTYIEFRWFEIEIEKSHKTTKYHQIRNRSNNMGMEKFDMYAQLYESQRRYQRSCDQLVLLNAKLGELQKRYCKAKAVNHRNFRYHLRMRILVVEGILNAYLNYACLKKNEILDLRFKLFNEDPSDGEGLYDGSATNDDEDTDVPDDESGM